MKYLFFDCECSNSFNNISKICEFGYVITDESFNILEKEDLLINPGEGKQNRFNLLKKDRELHLYYEKDDYKAYFESPYFDYYYDKIRSLLTDPDTIIFGYACDQDMLYIHQNNIRYGKEKYLYNSFDIQKLVKLYDFNKIVDHLGLESVYKMLYEIEEIDSNIFPHKADDDSLMSMYILKRIVEISNKSISELMNEYSESIYDLDSILSRVKTHKNKRRSESTYNKFIQAQRKDKNEGKKYNYSVYLTDLLKDSILSSVNKTEDLINKSKNDNFFITDSIKKANVILTNNIDDLNKTKEEYHYLINKEYYIYSNFKSLDIIHDEVYDRYKVSRRFNNKTKNFAFTYKYTVVENEDVKQISYKEFEEYVEENIKNIDSSSHYSYNKPHTNLYTFKFKNGLIYRCSIISVKLHTKK